MNGVCTLQSLTGTTCDEDGNPCTSDVCSGGACTHPSNSDPCADDGNVCTDDVCSGGACTHPPTRDFTGCSDGDACTIMDQCNGGICSGVHIQDCYDGNPCTDDNCIGPGDCSNPFNTRPCNDLNQCTTDGICTNGTCVGTPIECPDLDPCQPLLECDPWEGCIYDMAVCDDENNCTLDACGAEGCKHVEIGCTGFVCDDPGTPNTGETEIFGQLEWSTTLQACNANSVQMPVLYRIVTHDTPRSRVLSGKLSLSLVSGDPSIVEIKHGNQSYSLDSLIPVTIFGHFEGCGLHDWHDDTTVFQLIGRSPGEITLKASMDPDPECCEGDGEPTIEAQVTITVNEFEAVDLDIEGSFDSEEETAGGYISLYEDEDDLRALTVSRHADVSGPGTVTLNCESGCSNIQLYRLADRSLPVGLPLTWLVPGGALPTLYVEGVSVSGSARDVQLKLEYSPFVGEPCYEDVVRMTVVEVTLVAVGFASDHGLMRDNEVDFEPTGSLYFEPEWVPSVPYNNPISHTMGLNVQVGLVISIKPNDMPAFDYAITGTSSEAGFNFSDTVNMDGGLYLPDLTSTDILESKIQKITPEITWTITSNALGGVTDASGPHTVYVTLGTPLETGNPLYTVTKKRMERAVQQAGAANSVKPHEIIKTVVQAQEFSQLEFADPGQAWTVPDISGGVDCQSIIRFAQKVAKQIGCPGVFDHVNIYAIEIAPWVAFEDNPNCFPLPCACCGLNTNPRRHPQNPEWVLSLVAGGGCNPFEATARFTYCGETRFYPAGTDKVYANKDDVLYVFDTMSWVIEADFPGCTLAPVPPVFTYSPDPPNAPIPGCP